MFNLLWTPGNELKKIQLQININLYSRFYQSLTQIRWTETQHCKMPSCRIQVGPSQKNACFAFFLPHLGIFSGAWVEGYSSLGTMIEERRLGAKGPESPRQNPCKGTGEKGEGAGNATGRHTFNFVLSRTLGSFAPDFIP